MPHLQIAVAFAMRRFVVCYLPGYGESDESSKHESSMNVSTIVSDGGVSRHSANHGIRTISPCMRSEQLNSYGSAANTADVNVAANVTAKESRLPTIVPVIGPLNACGFVIKSWPNRKPDSTFTIPFMDWSGVRYTLKRVDEPNAAAMQNAIRLSFCPMICVNCPPIVPAGRVRTVECDRANARSRLNKSIA